MRSRAGGRDCRGWCFRADGPARPLIRPPSVRGWKVTQAVAARRLGVTQPRLNDLLRGKIDRFSLDTLIDLATRAGLSVRIDIAQAA